MPSSLLCPASQEQAGQGWSPSPPWHGASGDTPCFGPVWDSIIQMHSQHSPMPAAWQATEPNGLRLTGRGSARYLPEA